MWLLGESVEGRIDVLERYRVCEKTADKDFIDMDLRVLWGLKTGICLFEGKKR